MKILSYLNSLTTRQKNIWWWRGWLLGFVVFMALILTLAYQGQLPAFFRLPFYDKIGHFYLLGMFTYLAHRATDRQMVKVGRWQVPVAVLGVLLLTMVEEGFQARSPYRTFSLMDLTASVTGILFFWGLDSWLRPETIANV